MRDLGERFVRHAFGGGRAVHVEDGGGPGKERLYDIFIGFLLAFRMKKE